MVLDCPDPAALAAFYAELLGQPVTYSSDDLMQIGRASCRERVCYVV